MIYDVIVVGSGSAGTAAAISCKKYNLKTLVITVATLENLENSNSHLQSVHPGVLVLLKELGLLDAIYYSACSKFDGIHVNGKFNSLSENDRSWKGYHLKKNKFNQYLLKYLIDNHFEIIAGSKIQKLNFIDNDILTISVDGKVFHSKYIIDATGRSRKFGRSMNLRELILSPSMTCWTGTSEINKKVDLDINTHFKSSNNNWVWTAPGKNNQFTWVKLIVDKKESFINPFPFSNQIYPVEAFNVRWRIFRPLFNKGVLLCGDAAGILDPSAGQGILIALASAMMASQTIAKCVNDPKTKDINLVQYDQWFVSQFEDKVENLKNHYSDLGIIF